MNEIELLQERVKLLEDTIHVLVKSDRYVLQKTLQVQDGQNIQVGRNTGTNIGTATDQKLAFYGVTPVDQPATVADPSGGSIPDSIDSQARTAINSLIDRLQELGLIA